VTRLMRATSGYLSDAQQAAVIGDVERLLLTGASNTRLTYGMRKNQLDAYISVARTPAATVHITSWLDSISTAGLPLRQPTRWAIVTHLVERGAADADALIANEARHDTTTSGRRSAFVAGAGRPRAEVKREYFDRYFRD